MSTRYLLDIAKQCYPPHDPVPGPDVGLEVDGADVVELRPARLPVDRALIQLTVLTCTGVTDYVQLYS